jgi:hypothetical protein
VREPLRLAVVICIEGSLQGDSSIRCTECSLFAIEGLNRFIEAIKLAIPRGQCIG